MAQVCGGSNFDWISHQKQAAALRLLREAADQWIFRGEDALEIDRVLGVLIRVLIFPWSSFDIYRRRCVLFSSLAKWTDAVESLETELVHLTKPQKKERTPQVMAELREVMQSAARSWIDSGAERPRTVYILRLIVTILFRHGLVRLPPPRNLEELF